MTRRPSIRTTPRVPATDMCAVPVAARLITIARIATGTNIRGRGWTARERCSSRINSCDIVRSDNRSMGILTSKTSPGRILTLLRTRRTGFPCRQMPSTSPPNFKRKPTSATDLPPSPNPGPATSSTSAASSLSNSESRTSPSAANSISSSSTSLTISSRSPSTSSTSPI